MRSHTKNRGPFDPHYFIRLAAVHCVPRRCLCRLPGLPGEAGLRSNRPMNEERDNCALPLVRRVYALLGQDDSRVRTGDPLPRGWHFILFTPTAPQTAIGLDGTPMRKGGPDAPAGLPRRM